MTHHQDHMHCSNRLIPASIQYRASLNSRGSTWTRRASLQERKERNSAGQAQTVPQPRMVACGGSGEGVVRRTLLEGELSRQSAARQDSRRNSPQLELLRYQVELELQLDNFSLDTALVNSVILHPRYGSYNTVLLRNFLVRCTFNDL